MRWPIPARAVRRVRTETLERAVASEQERRRAAESELEQLRTTLARNAGLVEALNARLAEAAELLLNAQSVGRALDLTRPASIDGACASAVYAHAREVHTAPIPPTELDDRKEANAGGAPDDVVAPSAPPASPIARVVDSLANTLTRVPATCVENRRTWCVSCGRGNDLRPCPPDCPCPAFPPEGKTTCRG